MTRLIIRNFSVSLDGFGAGLGQDETNPMGRGGMPVHNWAFSTRVFREMHGASGGTEGIDNQMATAGFENIGAWIIGRNMFGPVRGPWSDPTWNGWWGENPPYHVPVFVLTHHPRPALEMAGGTVFHFVTDGIHAALDAARLAAGSKDIRLGGGVATIRAYFQAGLVDSAHFAVGNCLLGAGEAVFHGLDLPALGYRAASVVAGEAATHYHIERNVLV